MKTDILFPKSTHVVSHHGIAEVWEDEQTGQHSLHSTSAYNVNDVICSFSAGEILNHPTYLTVQIDEKNHITLHPEFLQYINHGCAPNIFFDTTEMQIVCIAPIEAGDELRFFYPSTEWEMAQPFNCSCGAANCLHVVKGAAYLLKDILKSYKLNNFIKRQMEKSMP